MIPTREKGSSKKPKTKIKEFPIFFKNSKVESSIPKQTAPSSVKKNKAIDGFKTSARMIQSKSSLQTGGKTSSSASFVPNMDQNLALQ